MKRNRIQVSFLALIFLFLAPSVLLGQTERGGIVGVVTDATGAVVQNATVTITNVATNTTQTFITNAEGLYEAPFLVPAVYKVTVSHQGFSTTEVKDVTVNIGQRERVNITLQPGDIVNTVTVTDTTPLLQTESANISTVINSRQLTELPTSNRNIYSFLYLSSTVNRGPAGNADRFRVESQGTLSVSGTRASSVTFKIDGLANTDPTFGTPTITPSLDAVQEFQLQNNAYSAEFEGITQVNIATRAGTRRFHGSVFDFIQNDALQPRNPINPPDKTGKPGKNRLRFNQFGFSIGGPIWLPRFGEGGPVFFNKDRTFFFFNYEGRRQNQLVPQLTTVMTAAQRAGDFSAALGGCVTVGGQEVPLLGPNGAPSGGCVRVGQIFDPATTVANPLFNPGQPQSAFNPQFIRQPFANNQIPADRINPIALALINVQQPLPNIVTAGDNNFLGTGGRIFDNDQYSVRIDHRFSDTDSIYGRLAMQENFSISKSALRYVNITTQGKGRVFNSTWTHIFSPTLVNEFRVGFVRGIYGDTTEDIDPTQFGIQNTFLNNLPLIGIQPPGSPQLNVGGFSGSILATVQNTYQLSNNVSWIRGRHALKFGGKIDHNRFKNADYGNTNGRAFFNGLFTAGNSSITNAANRNNGVADFLLGLATSNSLTVTRPAYLRNTPWAVYFQDDWKVSKRITVNLGLRYEFHQPFREEQLGGSRIDLASGGGRILVADPRVAAAANSEIIVCCTDERVVEADRNDFGPRIGVSIQPFKTDPTVIRAGYGLFYADTSQFFHWGRYTPVIGTSFQPITPSFQNPAISLSNLFPTTQFTPPTGGFFVGTPGGVNPAAIGNRPITTGGGLGSYKTPQSHQWSLSIQREVMRNLLVDISYTGNISKNLPAQWFFNEPAPSAVSVNLLSTDPAANPYLRRTYSNFAIGSSAVANILESSYNAMTLKVERRFAQGFSFLSNYTWSKSIDEGSEVFSLAAGNFAFLADNRDLRANRALSAYDVRHRWVTSWIAELPFGRGKRFLDNSGWTDKLLGGWQFSGVFTLQSGSPFSPYIRGRNLNNGLSLPEYGTLVGNPYFSDEEWDARVRAWREGSGRLFIINPAAVAGNPLSGTDYPRGTRGTLSRNIFRTPYGRGLDLSMAKIIRLGEVTRFELRVDMLNATWERLHRLDLNNHVASDQFLTNALMGSIGEYRFFFNPRVIQLGLRFTF